MKKLSLWILLAVLAVGGYAADFDPLNKSFGISVGPLGQFYGKAGGLSNFAANLSFTNLNLYYSVTDPLKIYYYGEAGAANVAFIHQGTNQFYLMGVDTVGVGMANYDQSKYAVLEEGGNFVLGGGGSFSGPGSSLTALNASSLASGTVATARLGSGTANSSTFLRGDGTWASAGGGSTTITNTTSAAGVVTGGSGSFGIGTNLTSVAGGTNSFFVAAAAANSWTNRIGDSWLLSGANSVLTVGTNTGNNTVITDGYGSFANGFWVDAGAQEYFVGKVNVGVNRGDFSLNSGTVSNITSTATLTASNVTALGTATANSVVANAILKEPKGTWGGPTNTLAANGGYYEYSSATDCAVTNISDGGGWWGTLAVSNSSAANITLRLTDARIRVTGTASTNALVIPSAKVGFLSGLRLGSTNGVTTVGQ